MNTPEEFQRLILGVVPDVKEAIEESGLFEDVFIGEVSFSDVRYPCVSLIMGRGDHSNVTEYDYNFDIYFIFENERQNINLVEHIETVSEVLPTIEQVLDDTIFVGPYRFSGWEPFVSETNNNSLFVFVVNVFYNVFKDYLYTEEDIFAGTEFDLEFDTDFQSR